MARIKSPSANRATAKLSSPCISVCQMDIADEFCIGCYRTRSEIASWLNMDKEEQLHLLDILSERRAVAMAVRWRSRWQV